MYVGAGSGLSVSKIHRLSQPDDKLGNGIDYTFVEDKTKFVADDATLRLALVSHFRYFITVLLDFKH